MGLSNEERYRKFFNGLRILRIRLEKFKEFLKTDYHENKERVDTWIKKVDYISGILTRKLDFNGAYWLFGPNSENLQGLYGDSSGLSYKERDDLTKDFSVEYYLDTIDIVEFSKILAPKNSNAIELAHWWNCQQAVGYILYPAYRYQDDCFPEEALEELTVLSGQMALSRHLEEDAVESHHVEQVLLTKYKVFRHMLMNYKPTKKFDRYKTEIDISQFYDKVKEMSLPEVEVYLEEAADKEYKSMQKYEDDERAKKSEVVDGLVGKLPVRSCRELDRILDTSNDYEECKRADLERQKYYSTFGGSDWETRCKKASKKKKK